MTNMAVVQNGQTVFVGENMEEILANTMNPEETYKAHKERLKSLLDELRESARTYFKDAVNKLFDAYPVLESFSWTQYTPYWCDGDPCEFRVCGVSEVNGDSFCSWTAKKSNDPNPLMVAGKQASQLVSSIDSNDMLSMFGDHVKVIATRDGVTTEVYDHE